MESRADRLALIIYKKRMIVKSLSKWAIAYADSGLKSSDDRYVRALLYFRALSRQMTALSVYQWSFPVPSSSSASRLNVVCEILSKMSLELIEDSPTIAQILEFISSRARESVMLADMFKEDHLARKVIVKWMHRHHVARCERLLMQYRVERDLTRMYDGLSSWSLSFAQNKLWESNAVYHYSTSICTRFFHSLKESLRVKRQNRADAIVYSNYKILLKSWTHILTTFEIHNDAYDRKSQLLAASYHKTRVYKSVLMSLYDAVLSRKASVTESARIFLAAKRKRSFDAWRLRARDGERVSVYGTWRDDLWVQGFFKHWVGVRKLVVRNDVVADKLARRYELNALTMV